MRCPPSLAVLIAAVLACAAVDADEALPAPPSSAAPPADGTPRLDWPQFRGPQARGWVEDDSVPAAWNVATGENVRWRAPIAGLGLSSPVVAAGRIFLTTAVGETEADLKVGLYGDIEPAADDSPHRFELWCLDLATGERRWTALSHKGVPKVRRHPKSSHANSSPATDGERVLAFFGAEGLYCYDVDGKLLWKRDLGPLDAGYYVVPSAQWGFGSSPAIWRDRVVVQCDVQKGSFIAALDIRSGADIWRTPRSDVPTWSTPTIAVRDGTPYVIANGYKHIGAYALADGRELWRLSGGGDIPVPTPIVDAGLVYITSAHGSASPIFAIRESASGVLEAPGEDGKSDAIAWSIRRGGNYMQTPLAYRGLLFACRDNGVMSCFDAKTGERHWQERLGDGGRGFTASPVAGGDRIYATSEEGDVHVVAAAREFRVLGVQRLGEVCMATPAIAAGDTLLFRGRRHLIAIGAPREKAAE